MYNSEICTWFPPTCGFRRPSHVEGDPFLSEAQPHNYPGQKHLSPFFKGLGCEECPTFNLSILQAKPPAFSSKGFCLYHIFCCLGSLLPVPSLDSFLSPVHVKSLTPLPSNILCMFPVLRFSIHHGRQETLCSHSETKETMWQGERHMDKIPGTDTS